VGLGVYAPAYPTNAMTDLTVGLSKNKLTAQIRGHTPRNSGRDAVGCVTLLADHP
jgi:hypothetical protein